MDQRFLISIEKELNNFKYIFHLPVGAAWADAIAVAKEIADVIETMAKDAQDRADQAKEAAADKPEA